MYVTQQVPISSFALPFKVCCLIHGIKGRTFCALNPQFKRGKHCPSTTAHEALCYEAICDHSRDCFSYICSTFSGLSDEKKKAGILNEPQIRTLLKDPHTLLHNDCGRGESMECIL